MLHWIERQSNDRQIINKTIHEYKVMKPTEKQKVALSKLISAEVEDKALYSASIDDLETFTFFFFRNGK